MHDEASVAVRRARLDSQRLSDATRLGPDPVAIARAVCAVQAQSLDAARHSLRVRSTGLTEDAVNRALGEERTLAWSWLMRGTLHLCAAEDLRWLLALLGPLNMQRDATRRRQLGLDEATLEHGVRAIRDALAGGPLPRPRLREAVLARGVGIAAEGQALIHLIAHAAHRGVIVVTAPVGRDNTFTLLDDRVPKARVPSIEACEAELARRYFRAYAPATVADFAAWSGLPAPAARRAVTAIGGELREVTGPFSGLLAPAGAAVVGGSVRGARAPIVRLLPYFDTYLLGYRRRDLVLDPAHTKRIADGGWITPAVCVDGWVEGVWKLRRERKETAVEVSPFSRLSREVAAGVRSEVSAIGAYLGRPARLVVAEGHGPRSR